MTPAELTDFVAAQRKRQDQDWERTAWAVSHYYAMHIKKGAKPPTVDKLLGRKRKKT